MTQGQLKPQQANTLNHLGGKTALTTLPPILQGTVPAIIGTNLIITETAKQLKLLLT